MLKNISQLECQVGEKMYRFTCDMDSPLGDVKVAVSEFLKFIEQIEIHAKQEQEKAVLEKAEKEVNNG
jgi:hypothetical protein